MAGPTTADPDVTSPGDLPFEFVDRAVYVPGAETLVVADLHLGRAAASTIEAPVDDGADVRRRLESTFESVGTDFDSSPETVVVAGDLLHSFSSIPHGVERDLEALEKLVDRHGATLIVTIGNHDALLETVFDGKMNDAYRMGDEIVVAHGHECPPIDADCYVIGHDHPALAIEGRKLPCFLYGPDAYRGSDVLMLPPFTRAAPGATVNGMSGRDFQSPLVVDADAFHPAIYDREGERLLWFPTLERSRSFL